MEMAQIVGNCAICKTLVFEGDAAEVRVESEPPEQVMPIFHKNCLQINILNADDNEDIAQESENESEGIVENTGDEEDDPIIIDSDSDAIVINTDTEESETVEENAGAALFSCSLCGEEFELPSQGVYVVETGSWWHQDCYRFVVFMNATAAFEDN